MATAAWPRRTASRAPAGVAVFASSAASAKRRAARSFEMGLRSSSTTITATRLASRRPPPVVEDEAEERRDRDRRQHRHQDGATVAEEQAHVLPHESGKGSHDQSRNVRPVNVRKTDSRSARSVTTWRYGCPWSVSHRSTDRQRVRQIRYAGSERARTSLDKGDAGQRPQRFGRHGAGPILEFDRNHIARRRQSEQALQRVVSDHAAVVEDDDAVAEPLGLLHVVRRVEQRLAAPLQRLEVVEDRVDGCADRRRRSARPAGGPAGRGAAPRRG